MISWDDACMSSTGSSNPCPFGTASLSRNRHPPDPPDRGVSIVSNRVFETSHCEGRARRDATQALRRIAVKLWDVHGKPIAASGRDGIKKQSGGIIEFVSMHSRFRACLRRNPTYNCQQKKNAGKFLHNCDLSEAEKSQKGREEHEDCHSRRVAWIRAQFGTLRFSWLGVQFQY
eukprot:2437314-Rhodomonas_salina.2